MTPDERLAMALAEIRREIASLQSQVDTMTHKVQELTDICRSCPGFGFDNEEPL